MLIIVDGDGLLLVQVIFDCNSVSDGCLGRLDFNVDSYHAVFINLKKIRLRIKSAYFIVIHKLAWNDLKAVDANFSVTLDFDGVCKVFIVEGDLF